MERKRLGDTPSSPPVPVKRRRTRNKGSLSYGKKGRKYTGTGTFRKEKRYFSNCNDIDIEIVEEVLEGGNDSENNEQKETEITKRPNDDTVNDAVLKIDGREKELQEQDSKNVEVVKVQETNNLVVESCNNSDSLENTESMDVQDKCGDFIDVSEETSAELRNRRQEIEQKSKDSVSNEEILEAYFKSCVEVLSDKDMLDSLVRKLHEADNLDDFVILVNSLSAGVFDANNIAFLLALERSRFETLKSSTEMRYSSTSKLFWRILYKQTSGRGIRLAGGPKNKGNIVEKSCERGKYDPKIAKANFAVPDVSVLNSGEKDEINFPSEIPPGLIPFCIDALPTDKDLVLLGDAKGLTRGQLPKQRGDVDMFGFEAPPTKQEIKQFFDAITSAAEQVQQDTTFENLLNLSEHVSHMIRKLYLRKDYFGQRRQGILTRFKREKNKNKYEKGVSYVNAMDYRIRVSLERMFFLSGQISALIAYLNREVANFNAKKISEISNMSILKDPSQLTSYDLDTSTELVKPGTDKWFQLRGESYVTTDNILRALGLSGAAAMKSHANFVKKETLEQKKMDVKFSTPVEMAKIASKVLPLVYPNATIEEIGVTFRDTELTSRFIAATPHCIMRREKDDICPVVIQNVEDDTKTIFAPSDEVLTKVLLEMLVLDASNGLLVFMMSNKLFVQLVDFNECLANTIVQAAVDLYDKENTKDIQVPKMAECTWRNEIQTGLKEWRQSLDDRFCVLCLPCGEIGDDVPDDATDCSGHFLTKCSKAVNEVSTEFVEESVKHMLQTCDHELESANNLLRPQADEIFAIMATDTDRVNRGPSSQLPICYGLKGGGLPTSMLRAMMDEVKNELLAKGRKYICEVYDGYSHSYCERTADGQPLYLTRLQQDTWKLYSDLGKPKLLQKIDEITSVKSSLAQMAEHSKLQSACLEDGNILVVHTKDFPCPKSKRNSGALIVSCTGGPQKHTGIMDKIHSSTGNWFGLPACENVDFAVKTIVDYIAEEDELDDTLEYNDGSWDEKMQMVSHYLLHRSPVFLTLLLTKIRASNRAKWKRLTRAQLLQAYLTSADAMVKKFTLNELALIRDHVKNFTGMDLFPRYCKTKPRQCSVVAQTFGGDGHVTGLQLNPLSLATCCKDKILAKEYPVDQLKVALAEAHHSYRKEEWLASTEMPMEVQVDRDGQRLQLFSFAEYSHQRSCYEPKIIDPYHVLTNLRKGSTSGNYEKGLSSEESLCHANAWRKVVQKDSKLLNYSIVDDCVDKQSMTIARRVFSTAVQDVMRDVGEEKTAVFVYNVRSFYEACDTRGISADARVNALVSLQKYLTSGISFDSFPPPGTRVKGIPIVTYEAMLANVATRIQLYSLCSNGTYNHRAISSLACENFFSTLAATSPTGSPRATDIPKSIAQLVNLNHYKHVSPDQLGFHFQTASKLTYDVHSLDDAEKEVKCDGFWKNHQFDECEDKDRKSKFDKGSYTHDLKPLKGVRPIRARHYKIDEQKLNTLKRMGVDSTDLLRFGIPLEWQV